MNRSIGGFILYIGVALYLLSAGLIGIFSNGGEFSMMVGSIFGGGGLSTAIAIIFSVAAIIAGVLLLLQLFGMEFGIINIILIVIAILWILFIIVHDIFGLFRGPGNFLFWLSGFAIHLVVLGAIATGTSIFGGGY
ncbi:MAG: hypothetical protein FWG07_00230 [Treponema sp.]|nr:hypothetical protein [Treponema sp.]